MLRECSRLALHIQPLLCSRALVAGVTGAAPGREDGMTTISRVAWPALSRAEFMLLWE